MAGGSSGTASWGWAIFNAASALRTRLREEYGGLPAGGLEASGAFETNPEAQQFSMHAFGAQFAEVRVNVTTGEVRVPRLLGVFAAGRIINPKTARSQLLGGMTWARRWRYTKRACWIRASGIREPRFRGVPIATNADVGTIDVAWLEEEDLHVNQWAQKG